MLKNVEDNSSEKIEGYCFVDEDGTQYEVVVEDICVDIGVDGDCGMTMYKKDIPRFIKVLEAAYAHKGPV